MLGVLWWVLSELGEWGGAHDYVPVQWLLNDCCRFFSSTEAVSSAASCLDAAVASVKLLPTDEREMEASSTASCLVATVASVKLRPADASERKASAQAWPSACS